MIDAGGIPTPCHIQLSAASANSGLIYSVIQDSFIKAEDVRHTRSTALPSLLLACRLKVASSGQCSGNFSKGSNKTMETRLYNYTVVLSPLSSSNHYYTTFCPPPPEGGLHMAEEHPVEDAG